MKKVKVCHLTTVHPVFDVRIFHKECMSLANHGYNVFLIARHTKDERMAGINIISVQSSDTKGLWRVLNAWQALKKAISLKANIYHFHDPELLPVGVGLKLLKKVKVIYDVHEDIKKHALGKSWFKPMLRPIIALTLCILERFCEYFIDLVIIAEDAYAQNFKSKTIAIYNYPIIKNYAKGSNSETLVYVGAIREKRGIFEMIDAVAELKAQFPKLVLYLIGQFFPPNLEQKVRRRLKDLALEKNIIVTGRLPFTQIFQFINRATIGLAVLHPDANYVNSRPTKMFEYMLLGKPVVVSNFPLWEKIVNESVCGFTINPLDPADIAQKISYLLRKKKLREKMGASGRHAVLTKYNWSSEEQKLFSCYRKLSQI